VRFRNSRTNEVQGITGAGRGADTRQTEVTQLESQADRWLMMLVKYKLDSILCMNPGISISLYWINYSLNKKGIRNIITFLQLK
jgi:hypothetical protein